MLCNDLVTGGRPVEWQSTELVGREAEIEGGGMGSTGGGIESVGSVRGGVWVGRGLVGGGELVGRGGVGGGEIGVAEG